MNKLVLLLFTALLIFAACASEESSESIPDSSDVIVKIIPDINNNTVSSDTTFVEETDEELRAEAEEFEKTNNSSGYYIVTFKEASTVEGSVGLHFIEEGTGGKINFYYYSIDPVKEGLFEYVENEESIFPVLKTNLEIINVPMKIYWELEYFQADLTDWKDYYKVLKKIERVD